MRSNKRSTRLIAVLVILASTLFASPGRAAAQQETILHSFPGSSEDGYDPTPRSSSTPLEICTAQHISEAPPAVVQLAMAAALCSN